MPPARRRSPCSPQRRNLPKYKRLARDLPGNARETLERVRYGPNPRGGGYPCHPVAPDAPGRTTCYHPSQHSARRRTCNLLVDPASPLVDFPQGLYLVGGPRFRDEALACRALDLVMAEEVDVDRRAGQVVEDPPDKRVAVLGPYPHPATQRLTVKCILVSALEDIETVEHFGGAFTTDFSERGANVPDVAMLEDFIADLRATPEAQLHARDRLVAKLEEVARTMETNEDALTLLQEHCDRDADFQRKVRTMVRCLFEKALYYRRWAGPDRKLPLDRILPEVGTPGNPISPKLRGKFTKTTATGVRLVARDADGEGPADVVMQPEGTLTNMSQALGNAVLGIFSSLDGREEYTVVHAFGLATPYRKLTGGYLLSRVDPNPYNGNPSYLPVGILEICFGTPTGGANHLYAHNSIQGTRTYCVQMASIQILRLVQTLLPYLYRSRPLWAAADGEFDHLHT